MLSIFPPSIMRKSNSMECRRHEAGGRDVLMLFLVPLSQLLNWHSTDFPHEDQATSHGNDYSDCDNSMKLWRERKQIYDRNRHGEIKNAFDLHYGKFRIQCFWNLTNTIQHTLSSAAYIFIFQVSLLQVQLYLSKILCCCKSTLLSVDRQCRVLFYSDSSTTSPRERCVY